MLRTLDRMSTLDAEFFYAEHDNVPMHIGSVAVFEGPRLLGRPGRLRRGDPARPGRAQRLTIPVETLRYGTAASTFGPGGLVSGGVTDGAGFGDFVPYVVVCSRLIMLGWPSRGQRTLPSFEVDHGHARAVAQTIPPDLRPSRPEGP